MVSRDRHFSFAQNSFSDCWWAKNCPTVFPIQVRGEQAPGDFDSGHQFRGSEAVEIVNLDIAPGILDVKLQVGASAVRVQGVDAALNRSPDLLAGRAGEFAFEGFSTDSTKVGGLQVQGVVLPSNGIRNRGLVFYTGEAPNKAPKCAVWDTGPQAMPEDEYLRSVSMAGEDIFCHSSSSRRLLIRNSITLSPSRSGQRDRAAGSTAAANSAAEKPLKNSAASASGSSRNLR